jgi:hypothetical protein
MEKQVFDTEHMTDVDGTYIVSTKEATAADYVDLEKPDTNVIRNLKTTADGSIILIPQPSDDPADPLNVLPLFPLFLMSVVLGKETSHPSCPWVLFRHDRLGLCLVYSACSIASGILGYFPHRCREEHVWKHLCIPPIVTNLT